MSQKTRARNSGAWRVTCYRGHSYCSEECGEQGRGRVVAAAKARHQSSKEGRRDHRDRQNRYRKRLRAGLVRKKVTDLGIEKLAESETASVAVGPAHSTEESPAARKMGLA